MSLLLAATSGLFSGCVSEAASRRIGRALEVLGDSQWRWQLAWSPHSDRLAVSPPRCAGVFLLDPALATTKRLSATQGTCVSWSPDAAHIAFLDDEEGSMTVVSLRAEALPAGAPGPASDDGGFIDWAPDGRWIAVSALEGEAWHLELRRPDGSERRSLASGFLPAWSPDGSWIAFSALHEGRWFLELIRPDGTDLRRLPLPGTESASIATWSPQGGFLACERQEQGDSWVFVGDPLGTGLHPLTRGAFPAWSPDGRRLAFVDSDAQTSTGAAAFVIGVDGTGRQRLCEGLFPRWSPAKDRLLVHRLDLDALVTIAADGSDEQLLARGGSIGFWSPDGERVAYPRQGLLFVIGADGVGERLVCASYPQATAEGPPP